MYPNSLTVKTFGTNLIVWLVIPIVEPKFKVSIMIDARRVRDWRMKQTLKIFMWEEEINNS